jgi:hypothetical protein
MIPPYMKASKVPGGKNFTLTGVIFIVFKFIFIAIDAYL